MVVLLSIEDAQNFKFHLCWCLNLSRVCSTAKVFHEKLGKSLKCVLFRLVVVFSCQSIFLEILT